MNRNRLVGGALTLVLAAGAVGWAVGTQITSPAEAAARAQAPEASLITVAVDERVLSADIIARGTISYDDPVSLETSGSTADAEARDIVTGVAAEGDELGEGDVALEIAGRPVLLLEGDLPVFRDLRPGATGLDVLQLEEALVRQGYLDRADETWDARTGAALQSLYGDAGYDAATASDTERDSLRAARDMVRMASQGLADANKELDNSGGASGSALLQAQAAVQSAEEALKLARSQRSAAIDAAKGERESAKAAVTSATSSRDVAKARLKQAQGGLHPDTGIVPSPLEIEELKAAVSDAELNLSAAKNAAKAAETNVGVVTGQEDATVASAAREVSIAKAQLTEARSPGDTTFLIRARDDARRALTEANDELARMETTVGTWLPAGEVIFVKSLPVQVVNVGVQRGAFLSGSFMTVSGAEITMTIGMQENDARRVSEGDRVIIDEPDWTEEPIEATIAEVPESSESGRVQVKVDLPDIPREMLGANVRVIIPVESTAGEVLVVPAAALSAVANGETRVEVEDPETPGETRFVNVITGLATDGVVEVRPTNGTLAKGDRVVVGQADIGPSGGDSSPGPTEGPSEEPAEEPAEDSDGAAG